MCERSGLRDQLERLAEPGAALQRQLVVLAVVAQRLLAAVDRAQDLDELARARERLREGLAVPALDHLRARHADAEDQAPVREMIDRHRGHPDARGCTRRDLHHGRAELDARGARADPAQRREGVGAVGLRGPHRVVAEALGLEHRLDRIARPGHPVADHQSQLHASPPRTEENIRGSRGGSRRIRRWRGWTARADA